MKQLGNNLNAKVVHIHLKLGLIRHNNNQLFPGLELEEGDWTHQ